MRQAEGRRREHGVPLGPRYQRMWAATAISSLGNGVLYASMPILARSVTSSPAEIGAVTAATQLPGLLVALHAGAVIDRLDRRRVMVSMDLARLAVLLAFSVLVVSKTLPIALIYVVAFLLGAGDVTFEGAARSVVPAIVTPERLDAANGRMSAAIDTMDEMLGPPTGVALFALAAWVPFLFDAGTFAASAILLATITGTFRAARPKPMTRAERLEASFRREIAAGLRFVRRSELLSVLAAGTATLAFFATANLAVLIVFVLDRNGLDLPRVGYGYLLMTIAIGGVLGSLMVERLTGRFDHIAVLTAAVALNGAAYLVFALAHNLIVGTIATVIWGGAVSTGMIISIGLRQALTPDHLLGRVMSVFRVLVGLGGVLGALLGGVLADVSVRLPYVCSGIAQLALAPLFGLALARGRAKAQATPEA